MVRARVALSPFGEPGLVAAVQAGGGDVADPSEAEALVWTNPIDPQGLKELLRDSPIRWVQLPFAGIEEFVAAGVLDEQRTWTCTKGAYGAACAEHALALILAASRLLHVHVRAGTWRPGGLGSPERRVEGTTAVVVGTGGIGAAFAPMARAVGMGVIGVNRSGRPLQGATRTVTVNDLHGVLPDADYVVVAAALTPETRGLFGRREFDLMSDRSWLVNVARGGHVQTDALVEALAEGSIAGAALDVTEPEPLPDDHPLWSFDNVIITPHVANTWDMALPALRSMVQRNVERFGRGEPLEGLVDPALGY